ncbi:unnamed protein product [Phytomonas sp. EM1]|nr:unnamed protein product [Phytomonas sp. EM1]|eukprot:CCW65176.1 unnamed protein product [Phytomonas sp. isolate EM1]
MLPLDVQRARSYGIGSPYQSIEDVMIQDPFNASNRIVNRTKTTISFSNIPEVLFDIKKYQNSRGLESGGWGYDLPLLDSLLLPALLWLIALLVMRYLCREPIARFGMYMGVVTENKERYRRRLAEGKRGTAALSARNQKRLYKFQNQVWLSTCYIVSSIFGYLVQRDKPWFTFPINAESGVHFLIPHPYNPPREIVIYYYYSLAFYASELLSIIFFERHIRRSDFLEYFIHHIFTMTLIGGSFIGWEHRYGAYVIFIHDISDIMLCVSKVFHYIIEEEQRRVSRAARKRQAYRSPKMFRILGDKFEKCCFFVFVTGFVYFRLYCLPMLGRSSFGMTPNLRYGNFNLWLLIILLNVCLQILHLYWTSLIIKMIIAFLKDEELTDIRSEPDELGSDEPDYVPWDAPPRLNDKVSELMHNSHKKM